MMHAYISFTNIYVTLKRCTDQQAGVHLWWQSALQLGARKPSAEYLPRPYLI